MADKMTNNIEIKDVEKLAALARITIPADQVEKVRKDIETILAYVGQINEANDLGADVTLAPSERYGSGVKNVLREDINPHESGQYTGVLLSAAPKTEKGFVRVKKIIS
jgi:aspartyl/glutamyl-tRNA(Asn/Gln) amidotransferase C subunit